MMRTDDVLYVPNEEQALSAKLTWRVRTLKLFLQLQSHYFADMKIDHFWRRWFLKSNDVLNRFIGASIKCWTEKMVLFTDGKAKIYHGNKRQTVENNVERKRSVDQTASLSKPEQDYINPDL